MGVPPKISGTVSILNGTTTISMFVFSNNSNLEGIIIPNSITRIEQYAFIGCANLNSIVYKGTVEQWNAIAFGDSWNAGVLAAEVICSDGTVNLKG